MRERAAAAIAGVLSKNVAAVRPDHQHPRQGQADRGRLAQVRAPDLVAQPRQPGRGRGRRRADRRRPRRLPAHLPPLLRAEGALAGPGAGSSSGTATRRCPRTATAPALGATPRSSCSTPTAASRRRWPTSSTASSTAAGSTPSSGPARTAAPSAIPTVPSVHPYVLMNYQGRSRDVMTLAHELGHGVHQVLAARQGPLMAGTPLTLAETASVFGEQLTFQALLAQETDPVRRAHPARGQDRGHAQHRRPPDRLLRVRAPGPRRAPQGAS